MTINTKLETEETPSIVASQPEEAPVSPTAAAGVASKTFNACATSTRPPKRVKDEDPEEAPVSNTSATGVASKTVNAGGHKPDSVQSSTPTRPTKKAKVEEYFMEIKWYYCEYVGDELKEYNYSIFADEIPKGTKFSKSRPCCKLFMGGETHEYNFTMCLVDSKAEDRKVLVEIDVFYWTIPVTLMHFHILTEDLADFSRKLWVAAGKNQDVYDDMAIEFGESRHSTVKVKTLVSAAMGIKGKSDLFYMIKTKMYPGATVKDSMKLVEMIFKTCNSAIFIAYEVDLEGLGLDESAT